MLEITTSLHVRTIGKKILIVEDNIKNLRLIVVILKIIHNIGVIKGSKDPKRAKSNFTFWKNYFFSFISSEI